MAGEPEVRGRRERAAREREREKEPEEAPPDGWGPIRRAALAAFALSLGLGGGGVWGTLVATRTVAERERTERAWAERSRAAVRPGGVEVRLAAIDLASVRSVRRAQGAISPAGGAEPSGPSGLEGTPERRSPDARVLERGMAPRGSAPEPSEGWVEAPAGLPAPGGLLAVGEVASPASTGRVPAAVSPPLPPATPDPPPVSLRWAGEWNQEKGARSR